jgi:hypothetical protein
LSAVARTRTGAWVVRGQRALILPSANATIAGFAAMRTATYVLVQGGEGDWLRLVRFARGGWSPALDVRAATDEELGFGGLALDRRGRAVVAWASLRGDGRTALLLWREGRRATAVTQAGFPSSDVAPAAAPLVLRDGSVRVVEGYAVPGESAAIEWRRSGGKWVGQYVFASALGFPTGAMRALAAGASTYAAWTQLYPTLNDARIVVTRNTGKRQTSQLLSAHALLVDFVLAAHGFEAAANDWIDAAAFGIEAEPLTAGLVVASSGASVELDGTLLGYRTRGSARQFLLARDGELQWFSAPARTRASVSAAASRHGNTVTVAGRVVGDVRGAVAVYRERPGETRALVAAVAPAADGSFQAIDAAPVLPAAYRAVYVDPRTGLPVARLIRDVVR